MPSAGLHAQAAGRVMRSLLFVPGEDARKLAKGLQSGADVLLVDLEDSVASGRKAEARAITAAFLREFAGLAERPGLFVRVNAFDTEMTDADLDAVIPAGAEGIMLPKSRNGQDVAYLSARIAVREAESGRPDGGVRIIAIATETAGSLFGLGTYAGASQRLAGLAWGAEDLAADLGAETNRRPDGNYADPYRLARTLTLLGANAAAAAAVDTVFTAFRDLDGLRAEAEAARRDGFTAKMAIHPAQVPVINAVFTPGEEAQARARKIVAYFAANPDSGVTAIDGEMIDRPHLRQAERLLARVGRAPVLA
jgi:citrate lyase subunit beta / citryl-CoA lyase